MAGQSTALVKFSIGTQSLTPSSDTYTEIGGVTSFGPLGDQAEVITYKTLGDGRAHKLAGTRDAGDFDLELAFDPADAGQVALLAAFNGNNGLPYNFRTTLNDALTSGAGPHHGTYLDFQGVVTSWRYAPGEVDSVLKVTATIAITSGVTKTAAA